jgi:hypothetical protein
MIEQKLQEKVEDTIVSAAVNEAKFPETNDPAPNVSDALNEAFNEPTENIFENPAPAVDEPEPIQVAGIGKVVTGIVKAGKEAEKRIVQPIPDVPVQQIGGTTVVREATDEEMQLLSEATGGTYTKGINFPSIAEGMEDFDLANYLAQLKDANSELFESARRGTINFDQLKVMAEGLGMDDLVLEWANRTPGSGDTAEKLLGGMLAAMELTTQTKSAFTAARAIPSGTERDAAYARARQMLTLELQLYANLSGAGSEAARTLYMLGASQKQLGTVDVKSRASELAKLLDEGMDIEHLGDLYLTLPDAASKAKFARGLIGKPADVLVEVFINSILAAPTTHMVNILGNSMFMATRQVENFVAAGIGKARTAAGIGSKERMRTREAFASLNGIRKSWLDSLKVAGKTMVTEEPTDFVTKIDVRDRRAIGNTGDLTEIAQQWKEGNIGPAFVNTMGVYYRMGGRALLAEDEFFKGMGSQSEIYRIAAMRSGDLYDELIAAGKTPQEAKIAAAAEEARLIANPTHDMAKTAQDAAREMTFQGDLGDNFFGKIQGGMSHPLAKIVVPFYKTPTNVIKETLKRTPLALLSGDIRRKILAGGREGDMALAQIATGSAIASTFAYMAMGLDDPDQDMIIVGNGPTNLQAKQAMERQGIQPMSINIKQEDGTYKSITYSRLDPISGLLTMAADFAYYSQYEDDEAVLEQLAMALTLGISQYAMDMPFLQGVSELAGALTNPDPKLRAESAMQFFGEKMADVLLAPLPTVSSFTAGIERMVDPTMSSPMMPEGRLLGTEITELPSFMRGFYSSLQKAKGRNPFFSDTVEPKLNLWGEEMEAGEGAFWEFISPIRIKNTRFSPVDKELQNLGGGIRMNPQKIDGVLLNATQYNRWVTIQNTADLSGSAPKFPGDEGYDPSATLLPMLSNFINSEYYMAQPTKDDKLEAINSLVSTYRSAAKQILRMEDSLLDAKINAVQ